MMIKHERVFPTDIFECEDLQQSDPRVVYELEKRYTLRKGDVLELDKFDDLVAMRIWPIPNNSTIRISVIACRVNGNLVWMHVSNFHSLELLRKLGGHKWEVLGKYAFKKI